MNSLKELREWALDNPEDGVAKLYIADSYLQTYDRMGSTFVLPKEHRFAKPVIEAFTNSPSDFAKWLFKVRDTLPKSEAREKLYVLYRRVLTRAMQRERRGREDAAVQMALKMGLIPDDYQTKLRYIRRLVLDWGKRRLAMLAEERKSSGEKHIPVDVQEELLAKFWRSIENEIEQGELPKP